jgi:hypothetical protein
MSAVSESDVIRRWAFLFLVLVVLFDVGGLAVIAWSLLR